MLPSQLGSAEVDDQASTEPHSRVRSRKAQARPAKGRFIPSMRFFLPLSFLLFACASISRFRFCFGANDEKTKTPLRERSSSSSLSRSPAVHSPGLTLPGFRRCYLECEARGQGSCNEEREKERKGEREKGRKGERERKKRSNAVVFFAQSFIFLFNLFFEKKNSARTSPGSPRRTTPAPSPSSTATRAP